MCERACAAVILAAGASTRLGQPKQLVLVGGEPLLRRTARLALEAGFGPIVVVLGFEAAPMREALAGLPVVVVTHDGWAAGMGSSLCCGMGAVLGMNPCPRDVLVLVCDQMALSAEVLRELLRVHARGERPITAARYAGRAGVPAIFSSGCFSALLEIEGDRGARRLLEQRPEDVALVEFGDGVKDLDTPEQLRELL